MCDPLSPGLGLALEVEFVITCIVSEINIVDISMVKTFYSVITDCRKKSRASF